jgi:PAS domain S-box-containing protein
MEHHTKTDITRSVISAGNMRKELTNIFTDSIILDNASHVVSISKKISEFLGYSDIELIGRSMFTLLADQKEESLLAEKLQTGFFEEWPVQLRTLGNRGVMYSVSGFHLGLISDIDDLVVLKLKNLEEIKQVYDKLEAKEHEIDDFVYHSAHSLRGPLATLKGLINLSQVCEDKAELDALIYKMAVFAQRLDDKLSKLINFAESGKAPDIETTKISLKSLGDKLRAFVERESIAPSIQFVQDFHDPNELIEKSDLVFGVLLNIASCCLQQARKEESELFLKSSVNQSFWEFELRTRGIKITQVQKEKLENVNFGYVNILNEPELANLYAAKKIVLKLDGSIRLSFPSSEESCVHILVPRFFIVRIE